MIVALEKPEIEGPSYPSLEDLGYQKVHFTS